MDFWHFLKQLTDPASILHYGGVALLLAVIFAETGLLIGFFLPGDSLVFLSGMFCSTQPELMGVNISVLLPMMIIAAFLGNLAAYWFGKKTGTALFSREDSFFFKKRYLETTRDFYSRHGGKTLVIGRFLPVIRTFAPILAGVIGVDLKKFLLYNISGAAAWITSVGLGGYFLGRIKWVEENVGYIVIALIIVTLIPLFWASVRRARARRKT
ncbi:MAG TPA: VTT domain-containing protein [Bacteroidia bacterium]|nr:VTT domain-containing protein [Bacteroidia bacterium]